MPTRSQVVRRAPPNRRERRRAATRERIFRAALRLFAARGVFATTVQEITEAADVGKGTFFNYFPTKEHLLAAFGEMQVAKVRAAAAEARRGQKHSRELLRRLIHDLAEEPGRSQALVRSLLAANMGSEPVRYLMRHNLGRGRKVLGRLIARGQLRGEVRRDRKAIELARYFQQSFFGALLLWTLHPPSPLEAWLNTTFDLIWAGIDARQGRAGTRAGKERLA